MTTLIVLHCVFVYFLSFYWQDCTKRKLSVLNLLTSRKSVLRPVGATRCTDSREIWHGQGARGSAWLCTLQNFTSFGAGWWWQCGPKKC